VLLAESGYGADALGLSRSLVDDWLVIRWITNRDSDARGRRFIDFLAKQLERMDEVSEEYGPSDQPRGGLSARVQEVADEFSSWKSLGTTARAMAEEPEELDPGSSMHFAAGWTYDVLYFWTCCYIHPTPIGVRHRALPKGALFSFDAANEDDEAEQALAAVGTFLSQIANRASVFWGLNLTTNIEGFWSEYATAAGIVQAPSGHAG
jgi:hypothetical protein